MLHPLRSRRVRSCHTQMQFDALPGKDWAYGKLSVLFEPGKYYETLKFHGHVSH